MTLPSLLNKTAQHLRPAARLGLVLLILAGFVAIPYTIDRNGLTPSRAEAGFFSHELEIFDEVLELVAEKYVYPPDYRKLFSGVMEGMLASVPKDKLKVEDHGDGKTLVHGTDKLTYHLSFSRQDNQKAAKKVFHFLLKHFPGEIKEARLETNAIHGVMSALDAYSLYMDPEEFENSMRDTEGQYGGLGMVITMEDLKLTILKTMKDSPAERAGLLPGDIITHVDGEELKGMQIQELASKLRGYPDTQVSIQTLRPKTGEKKNYNLTREVILIESVQFKWLPDNTAYIKINSFSKQTNDQLEEALEQGRNQGMRAVILDLRYNPGGLLNQSVMVASHFLEQGRLIVYTRGRHVRDSQEYDAIYEESLPKIPLAVLINHHSASASEIVAGSLRDSGKAILIGENTYGKGSVQTIFKMSDGSGLRLTTSKYFTPSGIDITLQGITPEIMVEKDLPPEPGEPTLSKEPEPRKETLPPDIMKVKESEILQYLKGKGISPDRELDSQVHLARFVLRNSRPAKSHTLARARELVREMHY